MIFVFMSAQLMMLGDCNFHVQEISTDIIQSSTVNWTARGDYHFGLETLVNGENQKSINENTAKKLRRKLSTMKWRLIEIYYRDCLFPVLGFAFESR